MSDDDLTEHAKRDIFGTLGPDELTVVLKVLAAKLPPVLRALEEGHSGWKQILVIASYLIAGTLDRHPELFEAYIRLFSTFGEVYPQAAEAFARLNPTVAAKVLQDDVAYFVVPTADAALGTEPQADTVH